MAPKPNEWQANVIGGRVLIPSVCEAVPGSGKTFMLEHLTAALIDDGEDPAKMGYFTFSNNAASEGRRRIACALYEDLDPEEIAFFEDPKDRSRVEALGFQTDGELAEWLAEDPILPFIVDRVCTIHALSYRLLRWRWPERPPMVLKDKLERTVKDIIRDSMKKMNWEDSIKSVGYWIGQAINNLVEPEKSEGWFAEQLALRSGPIWAAPKLATIYQRRQSFMRAKNLVDFNMMQARVVELLRYDMSFREWAQGMFDIILVDEAQDTSPIQAEILFTLAQRTRRIIAVGDVDQSMYAFRGAVPSILREDFEAAWPDVERYNLPRNYRSTRMIVDMSAKLISSNYREDDQKKYLKPFEPRPDAPDGNDVVYTEYPIFEVLADDVATMIEQYDNPGGIYVLSRTRAECALIHVRCIERGVPAINMSGGLLFGAPHVRKVLAYARLACNYNGARDDMEIVGEIANVATIDFKSPMTRRDHQPGCTNRKGWVDCGCDTIVAEGVDHTHTRHYGRASVEEAGSWLGIKEQRYQTNKGGFPTLKAKGSKDLVAFVERLETMADNALLALNTIISDSVLPYVMADEGISDEDLADDGKQEDFGVLLNMVEPGMTLEDYLDRVEELTAASRDPGALDQVAKIATIHWSKGSQAPFVIVNATRLPIIPPTQRPNLLPTSKPSTTREERRLFYVAITRAQENARIVGALEWNGQETLTSPFVAELGLNLPPEVGNEEISL